MPLDIAQLGLVQRLNDGRCMVYKPGKHGGAGLLYDVPDELADAYRLADGDVVEGDISQYVQEQSSDSDETDSANLVDDDQPPADLGNSINDSRNRYFYTFRPTIRPLGRFMSITSVNGLYGEEAFDRPSACRRANSERIQPERRVELSCGPDDITGRCLDFAAPFGLGALGLISGQHASGLTYTLRTVVQAVSERAKDVEIIVLLLRARGEEITDWRRRCNGVTVIACPSLDEGQPASETLRMVDLSVAHAQRLSELGRHVLLAVDSLSAVWAAMLEETEHDGQFQADRSPSRQRMVDLVRKAGNFGGEGPLGRSLGGSITILGAVWNQKADEQLEEYGELHPQLRLMEHLLHESGWRVPMSETLARKHHFPAVDPTSCVSSAEERLLDADSLTAIRAARSVLVELTELERWKRVIELIGSTSGNDEMSRILAGEFKPKPKPRLLDW